ncbi:SdiA-regulated domain-containing protein [Segetibacter koreensis]|uniref:SdiA-regulated domain-containing protein n=1 Tax=Segetibacter koreensis TaxID=398037 RepID=UPI00036382F7|nr:SdiA-regulated domain-containing protein [Segetibacter koreensis]
MITRKLLLSFSLFLFAACIKKKETDTYPSLPGYDLTNPVMIHLKTNLDEISGINYYPKDTSIFAVDDEEGVLYKIYIRKQVQVKKWKFSGEADYEDILLYDSTFYALQSNGHVKAFTFLSKDSLQSSGFSISLQGDNEFETLYYDPSPKKIIVLCKNCASDSSKSTSAYAFDPGNHTFSDTPFFTINTDDIAEEIGVDKIKFSPSAAAVHPLTKDVYIISSVNKLLVIANHSGKIKDVYELDPRLFKQPEGITFTPAGDLIVSNEAADLGAPNILIFKYKPFLHDKG